MGNRPNATSVKISKYLSFLLRHSPGTIKLNMDNNGWVDINEFMYEEGHKFYLSENKIWPVNSVPVKYINVKDSI